MTVEQLQWLVGTAASVVVSVTVIAIGAFRAMSGRLDLAMAHIDKMVRVGDDGLHERINRLRQDVSDNYVRRIDLDGHLKRLDDTLKEVRDDQKEIIKQLARNEASAVRRSGTKS